MINYGSNSGIVNEMQNQYPLCRIVSVPRSSDCLLLVSVARMTMVARNTLTTPRRKVPTVMMGITMMVFGVMPRLHRIGVGVMSVGATNRKFAHYGVQENKKRSQIFDTETLSHQWVNSNDFVDFVNSRFYIYSVLGFSSPPDNNAPRKRTCDSIKALMVDKKSAQKDSER